MGKESIDTGMGALLPQPIVKDSKINTDKMLDKHTHREAATDAKMEIGRQTDQETNKQN